MLNPFLPNLIESASPITFSTEAVMARLRLASRRLLIRETPQSCGLPPIKLYKGDRTADYSEKFEKEFTARQIFRDYVFPNRLLWMIAIANAFVCGWISDKVFKGRRAPSIVMFMALVLAAVVIYWKNPAGNIIVDNIALKAIGFLIYGPVMLIGVQALDFVPKKAAGTAAGFTGLFGYLGGALSANIALGFVMDRWDWDGGFYNLTASCLLAILFSALTWNREKKMFQDQAASD